LKEITEAMDAIRVPHPPAFTPFKSSVALPVNWASNNVAGTLLIIWLARRDTKNSRFSNNLVKESVTCLRCPILPTKTNEPTMVRSKE